MDVPPIADATPEPPVAPPAAAGPAAPGAPTSPPPVERRLANLEAGVAEMNERLDALAVSLEASLREAVTQEVHNVSGELRHTVAELGRLLVRDLGKLSKLLSEHRDAIVAELGGRAATEPQADAEAAAGPPPAPPPSPGDGIRAGAEVEALYDDEVAAAEDDGGADGADEATDAGERQRRSLLRRRHG